MLQFSIINSLMIVLFLTGMVAMIMMRTLHRDFNRYNAVEATDDVEEETGWKLVHGDVFRPPRAPMMLAVLIGTGVQTFTMVTITMIFAVLGFLSPANRGGLMTAALLLFVFMGVSSAQPAPANRPADPSQPTRPARRASQPDDQTQKPKATRAASQLRPAS